MAAPFEFFCPTRMVVGVGVASDVTAWSSALGGRVLVVTGSTPARQDDLWSRLRALGKELTFVSVAHEPTVEMADSAATTGRLAGSDSVLAVGGGSVIDTAKAAAGLLRNPGSAREYLEGIGGGKPLLHPGPPLVVAPTTAGTGAEVTRNAVLASLEHRVKVSLRSPHLYPTLALVDPELSRDVPRAVLAAAGLDAVVQLIEALTSRRAQPMTDALCRDGLRRAGAALFTVLDRPYDPATRLEMAVAALMSGLALAQAGLGLVHGLAGVLGGVLPGAPHGGLCGCLLPAVIAANRESARATGVGAVELERRYADAAALLTGRAGATAEDLVAWSRSAVERAGLPGLREWGLQEEDLPKVAEQALRANSSKTNPVTPEPAVLEGILRVSLGRDR